MKWVCCDTAPDQVDLVCLCILFRGELIWERTKGAPPELDPDGFEEDPFCCRQTTCIPQFQPLHQPQLTLVHSSESYVSAPAEHPHPLPHRTFLRHLHIGFMGAYCVGSMASRVGRGLGYDETGVGGVTASERSTEVLKACLVRNKYCIRCRRTSMCFHGYPLDRK
jgi:hypothetical protein